MDGWWSAHHGPRPQELPPLSARSGGQIKNLCVKAPASDALARKDEIRGFAGERFEAALRIAIGKAQQETQVEVESPRHDAALKWLALELKRWSQPAGTDSNISTL